MGSDWNSSIVGAAVAGAVILAGLALTPQGAEAAPEPVAADQPVTADQPVPARKAKVKLLRPNLVVLKANDLDVYHRNGKRRLRFESGLGNIGRGPIEVRPNRNKPCPPGQHNSSQILYVDVDESGWFNRAKDDQVRRRSAGCMVFHKAHDHWHFEAAARYRLFRPRKDRKDFVVTARRKMSFCLRDSRRIPERFGSYPYGEYYGACSRRSPQGISIGWVDIYQNFLAGQSLRLPRKAGNGIYCLRITVDPQDQLRETRDGDNKSLRAFRVDGTRVTTKPVRRCR